MSVTGERIKFKREEKGLTQTKFGKLINKSKQVVSNWERGYSKPVDEDLIILSDILEVSTDYLLGKTNIPSVVLTAVQREYVEKIDLSDDQLINVPMYIGNRELTVAEKSKILKTARILLELDQK